MVDRIGKGNVDIGVVRRVAIGAVVPGIIVVVGQPNPIGIAERYIFDRVLLAPTALERLPRSATDRTTIARTC